MPDMQKIIEDKKRTEKIEKELRNKKRHWYLKQYFHRNLIQWGNLVLSIVLIISVVIQPSPWEWTDLVVIAIAGFNFAMWFWSGLSNQQNDLIEELFEINKKSLRFTEQIINNIRCQRQYME